MRKLLLLPICICLWLLSSMSVQAQEAFPYFALPRWSPDASKLAFAVGDVLEIWDVAAQQRLFQLNGHTNSISALAWSPDGTKIATSSYDQTVRIWEVSNGALLNTLTGHNDSVGVVVWSPDGSRILSGVFDNRPTLFVWDVATTALVSRHLGGTFIDIAFSPDGERFAVTNSLSVSVLDGQTYEGLAHSPRVMCCPNQMYSIIWSADSRTFVTGSINGLVTLWDAASMEMLMQFEANAHFELDGRDVDDLSLSWVRSAAFGLDGSTIQAVSGDGTVRKWDIASQTLIDETTIDPLSMAAWSPDGMTLAVVRLSAPNGMDLRTAFVSFENPFAHSEV